MQQVRTKAEFAAIRESVGMTQTALARELGVEVRSVKRWESPAAPGYHAPDDAWDVLDRHLEMHDRAVAFALGKVDEIEAENGQPPQSVDVTYWRSQADYDALHCERDGGDWRMANANARAVADALRAEGIAVRWVGSDELGAAR
jgi:transcriptional regulator with XRE-family HTH domain